jgi:hypothetical protein
MSKDADIANISSDISISAKTSIRPLMPILSNLLISQISGDNYNTLSRSAYSHSQSPVPSLANNMRGATFESGLTSAFLSCTGITPVQWEAQPTPFSTPTGGNSPGDAQHSLATFYLMALAAPGGKYYHRRSWSYRTALDQSYIINNGINSISMSVNMGGSEVANPATGSFEGNVMTIDDFAYRYPFPTFVTPTHNDGFNFVPFWAGAYTNRLIDIAT